MKDLQQYLGQLDRRSFLRAMVISGASLAVEPYLRGLNVLADGSGYVSFSPGAGTSLTDTGPNQVILNGSGDLQLDLQFNGAAESSFHRSGDRTYIFMPDSANRYLAAFNRDGVGIAGFDPSKPCFDPGNPWHGFIVPGGNYSVSIKEINRTSMLPLKVGVGVMSGADVAQPRPNFIDLANPSNPNCAPAASPNTAPAVSPNDQSSTVENLPSDRYVQIDGWGPGVLLRRPANVNEILQSNGSARQLIMGGFGNLKSGDMVGLDIQFNSAVLQFLQPGDLFGISYQAPFNQGIKFAINDRSGNFIQNMEAFTSWNTQDHNPDPQDETQDPRWNIWSIAVIDPTKAGEIQIRAQAADVQDRDHTLHFYFDRFTTDQQSRGWTNQRFITNLLNAPIYN